MKKLGFLVITAVLGLTVLGVAPPSATSATNDGVIPATVSRPGALPGLRKNAVVRKHAATGLVRFIGSRNARPVTDSGPGTAVQRARGFVVAYAPYFGASGHAGSLKVVSATAALGGRTIVRFQQLHRGVPVLAGDLVVDVARNGAIRSARGELSPRLRLSTKPSVSAVSAQHRARIRGAGELSGYPTRSLRSTTPRLWVLDGRLVGGDLRAGPRLVWRTEVTSPKRLDVREQVFVDATSGAVAMHFNSVNAAKNRLVCNANNTSTKVPCTSPYARTEGQAATGIADVDNAYNFGGGVYDFYKTRFNRDSIDGKGMALIQTVRYCDPDYDCPYGNAFWNGSQMVYGADYASADDVVGHELAHGVTERSSGLLYWFQSGAINEAMSDIFGELYDQTNGAGNDTAAAKWLMGEDLPIGAIRDMENPPAFGDPDRMTSANYYEGSDDNGGVHTNSGVLNKAAFLITDGGTFNGQTVPALGNTTAARLFYEVNVNILSSGSDYNDLYDALQQGCQNLVAVGQMRTSWCDYVRRAALATEMNLQPAPTFPGLPEAPMCATGQVPTDLFYDNMELAGPGKWIASALAGTNDWQYVNNYAPSGRNSLWAGNTLSSDTVAAMKTGVAVPAGVTPFFRFSHYFNYESGWDGGVVEYSTNGGATWVRFNPQINGYEGPVQALGGDQGYTSMIGGWFSSRASLPALAGTTVKFRFRSATDELFNYDQWFLDDVRVYTCATGSRPGPNAATNLLRNGAFEWDDNDDGYADNWTRNLGALRTDVAKRAGKYGLLFRATDVGPLLVSQQVPVTAGQTYRTIAQVRIPTTATPVSFQVKVQYRNSTGGAVGAAQVVRSFTDDTANVWTAVTGVGTAPTGATTATLTFQHTGNAVRVHVDDAVFRLN